MENLASHRIRLRISDPLLERLEERARESGVRLATELKRSLERGLDDSDPASSGDLDRLEVIALATLIGTEHLLQFLERTYPEGERRSAALREPAAEAAERRLDEVRERLAREAEA